MEISGPLRVDVLVIGVGHRRGCLYRAGDHEPGVLPDLAQVLHQRGVACVEPDAHSRQVGALRQRVHRDHALGAVLEDRAPAPLPCELDVALVAEHRNASSATPCRRRVEVDELAARVGGAVDP